MLWFLILSSSDVLQYCDACVSHVPDSVDNAVTVFSKSFDTIRFSRSLDAVGSCTLVGCSFSYGWDSTYIIMIDNVELQKTRQY